MATCLLQRKAGFKCLPLIDTLVWIPFFWIHLALFDRLPTVPAMLYFVILGTLANAYPIYFLTRWGQTLGKMAAKIRVVNCPRRLNHVLAPELART